MFNRKKKRRRKAEIKKVMKTISILFANTYKVHVTSLFSIAFRNNFVIFVISDITIIFIAH